MTPKEKANELFKKFLNKALIDNYETKLLVLITIDEVLNVIPKFEYGQGEKTTSIEYDYWQEVKNEIQKL